MKRIVFAVFIGLCAGVSALAPQSFLIGASEGHVPLAFVLRFIVGFFATLVRLPGPAKLAGAVVGAIVTVPYAMVTHDLGSLLVGAVLGGVISFAVSDIVD
jgi:hypothetical protein